MNKIEPFWDAEAFSDGRKIKTRNQVGRPRGVMQYRAVMNIDLLEECLDRASVHTMKFKHTFFYSIKKHLGKKSYKQFRKTIEKSNPIKTLNFMDQKWLEAWTNERK
jgi:hypothetical protein